MNNLYELCKDMPNPSKGILKFFKANPSARIWAYDSENKGDKLTPLKKTKEMKLSKLSLRVGMPELDSRLDGKNTDKEVRTNAFSGHNFKSHMFLPCRDNNIYLTGFGPRGKGIWFVDVTEKVIAALNSIGPCALSETHCRMEQISPRIKECKYCKRRLKKEVIQVKKERWVSC